MKKETREVTKDLLYLNGYNVEAVGSAEEALKLISVNQYDVILTDICLPGMSGWQFIQKVEEEFNLQNTSIAVLTGHPEVVGKILGIPIILKPYSIVEIQDFIELLIKDKNSKKDP